MSTRTGLSIFLPADVYDTLEFAALMWGGVGAGSLIDKGDPNCPIGLLREAGVNIGIDTDKYYANASVFGITALTSDAAVERINKRRGQGRTWDRVSFDEWCCELNVVRGDV